MSNNTIVRIQKNDNYTIIHNSVVQDDRLSWKARGILTYLLSLPNDWKVHLSEVVKRSPDGINSLRSGLKELKELGYVERFPIKEKGKITEWTFNVYEKPLNDFPHMEKPHMEKPHMENRTLLNTNNTNYLEILNTDNNKDIVEQSIDYASIVEYLNKVCGSEYKYTTKKTRVLIKARIKEGFNLEDFKTVIDKKSKEWLNTDMQMFLRPNTLFGTKFEGYLNQKVGETSEKPKQDNWITTDLKTVDFSKNREVSWMPNDD